ncbi:DUF4157 domain-containing protein [Nostoc sp. FACHB-133]|uniref:eCIS core domain-containing protein n=1 Tax=Nostoc sp. FACHB-133 TaxID=2692835 RepID=UPI0016841D89|nr:DUF4157 domain-containing protein [Nostoc sp. FACHB-133]MBD2521327.1 DUF4157 domain-containing protein [Nostoc sp. FACHB-133]
MSDRTFGHKKADTSTFSNPSLVSPTTPTLANPTRGFGLTTNNVIQTVTEESINLQEVQTADEQSLLSETIQQQSFGHDISRISLRRPQAKLTVGEPGDKYEQEADRTAAQVMSMPNAAVQPIQREAMLEEDEVQTKPLAASITPIVQREEISEEEEVQAKVIASIQREEMPDEEDVQTKPTLQRSTDGRLQADSSIESRLNSSKGDGDPLADEVRSFMEPRFGADFSQVRVHTDSEAVQMNRDLNAQAFTHQQDVYFGAGKSPAKDALTAHELTHVVQQSGIVNQKSMQRATTTLVQRDTTSDKLKDLETRTKVLEKKTAATQLDLKYRALFGEKTSTYKQIVYRLTGAFQSALSGYQGAHGKQAARDAVIDQIVATLVVVAGAAVLEPFLNSGLGKLQNLLGKASQTIAKVDIAKVVEKLENPINAAASGTGNIATTSAAGDRATNAPQPATLPAGGGGGTGGGDPLSFLTSNMEAIETHTQKFEAAFSNRATQYDAMTPDQWDKWNKETQEAEYSTLLKNLDTVALGDISKLEGAQTLAVKIELYLWAAWIKTQIIPGVRGLQLGGPLAKRLKDLGVESLADVKFDTESWVFMEHQPQGKWESNLHTWAQGWSQPLIK